MPYDKRASRARVQGGNGGWGERGATDRPTLPLAAEKLSPPLKHLQMAGAVTLCRGVNDLQYTIRRQDAARLGVGGFLTEFGACVLAPSSRRPSPPHGAPPPSAQHLQRHRRHRGDAHRTAQRRRVSARCEARASIRGRDTAHGTESLARAPPVLPCAPSRPCLRIPFAAQGGRSGTRCRPRRRLPTSSQSCSGPVPAPWRASC